MVYIRLPNFKTGINPSAKSRFDLNALTGITFLNFNLLYAAT